MRPKSLSCACAYVDAHLIEPAATWPIVNFSTVYKNFALSKLAYIQHWIQGVSKLKSTILFMHELIQAGGKPKRNERVKLAHSLYIRSLIPCILYCGNNKLMFTDPHL